MFSWESLIFSWHSLAFAGNQLAITGLQLVFSFGSDFGRVPPCRHQPLFFQARPEKYTPAIGPGTGPPGR
jgi:hypothetical protein